MFELEVQYFDICSFYVVSLMLSDREAKPSGEIIALREPHPEISLVLNRRFSGTSHHVRVFHVKLYSCRDATYQDPNFLSLIC